MTPEREDHLRAQIRRCACLDELSAMRAQLSRQGELTTTLMAAIRDRQDLLAGVARGTGARQ